MDQILDSSTLVPVVVGIVPNLFLILWAMARLSQQVRVLTMKVSMMEGELKVVDQSLNNLGEEYRRVRINTPAPVEPVG